LHSLKINWECSDIVFITTYEMHAFRSFYTNLALLLYLALFVLMNYFFYYTCCMIQFFNQVSYMCCFFIFLILCLELLIKNLMCLLNSFHCILCNYALCLDICNSSASVWIFLFLKHIFHTPVCSSLYETCTHARTHARTHTHTHTHTQNGKREQAVKQYKVWLK
jgi:hypothetical protein